MVSPRSSGYAPKVAQRPPLIRICTKSLQRRLKICNLQLLTSDLRSVLQYLILWEGFQSSKDGNEI